jgi:hypothetical protein
MQEEIFVIAKTYPTRSKKYKELVCTAGINKNGDWVRIYPIPFRSLEEYRKFKKYTWISAEIVPDSSDPRPESHKINTSSIEILEHIPPEDNWILRKQLILEKSRVYTNLKEIIEKANTKNQLSLCTFLPTKYLGVEILENQAKEPTQEEEKAFKNANRTLFDTEVCEVEFTGMPYIPYKFKIKFEDDEGTVSSMSVIDWEFSQLYLYYAKKPQVGAQKVKEKIESLFEKDMHLFLGTMRQMHGWTKNPYTIIGVFYPPKSPYYQGRFDF